MKLEKGAGGLEEPSSVFWGLSKSAAQTTLR